MYDSEKTYYNISKIEHDELRRRLYVTVGSRVYTFEDATKADYMEFLKAPDQNAHFEMIKRSFIQLRDV